VSGRRIHPSRTPRISKDLRTAWLLLLLRAKPSYGYVLRRELQERGLEVDAGSLYRSLRELEGDGLISSRWRAPSAGPRSRIYTLTEKGHRALVVLASAIELGREVRDEFLAAYGPPDDPAAAASRAG
jgi:DNA-binding PadR family transcriptional regulator